MSFVWTYLISKRSALDMRLCTYRSWSDCDDRWRWAAHSNRFRRQHCCRKHGTTGSPRLTGRMGKNGASGYRDEVLERHRGQPDNNVTGLSHASDQSRELSVELRSKLGFTTRLALKRKGLVSHASHQRITQQEQQNSREIGCYLFSAATTNCQEEHLSDRTNLTP
jgi:hypothetical protein